MRLSIFLIASFFFIGTAYGHSPSDFSTMSYQTATPIHPKTNVSNRPIKYFPIRDTRNNMMIGAMPIPQDWDLYKGNDKEIFLESSKGVQVSYAMGNSFMYANDPWMNQNFQQMGFQVQAPKSVEQLIQQDLIPHAKSQGVSFVRKYELPQLARYQQNLDAMFFKSMPTQNSFRCVATEWKDEKGISSILLIKYHVSQSQMSMSWGYIIESMEAPAAIFDQAKRDYINGMLNTQINPQWVRVCNQQARQQSQQSAAMHQQRMNALRAQGNQIIEAGKQHDAMTTRSHERFMDQLNDRVTVTHPSTGQSYKVDMGSNHYWINDNHELITTDNANYNPNGDLDVNGMNWVEAQIQY